MNKAFIKSFSMRQRLKLIDSAKRIADQNADDLVIKLAIENYGFENMAERTAYFWFYRLTSIRLMEAYGIFYCGERLFSTSASELTYKELHSFVLEKCHILSRIMPSAFDMVQDLEEILFPDGLTEENGLITELTKLFTDDDLKNDLQIMGWLYQYWNSSRKDQVFDDLKRNIKVASENIPAATQIFTPDWIVRSMTENTLGRLWSESHPKFDVSRWKYYIGSSHNTSAERLIHPENIRFIDPCMGSGNILLTAFDMLMEMYSYCGYSAEKAVVCILKYNLCGLEIDQRACKLAHFLILMKAESYFKGIIYKGIKPELAYFPEITVEYTEKIPEPYRSFIDGFNECTDAGSLIRVTGEAPEEYTGEFAEAVNELIHVQSILSRRYDVVVTNPPYMGSSNMNHSLLAFVKKYYYDYRADLFSAFIVRCIELAIPGGYTGFLTPYVWMFIQSYEKLRKYLFSSHTLETLIQFEYSAFDDATVPLCTFTVRNKRSKNKGIYIRLTDFKGGMEIQRQKILEAVANRSCGYVYEADSLRFSEIPGNPAAYWVSERILEIYRDSPPLRSFSAPRKGNSTSDNKRFLRRWYEVDKNKMNLGCKELKREESLEKRWFPYNKGGGYRKWYGFNDYLIDWYDDAAEIRKIPSAVIANYNYFMKPGLTWSTLTSGKFSIRWFEEGYIFDNGGCCIFDMGEMRAYICALLNSKVFAYIFGQLNPTLNFQSGDVARFPVIYQKSETIDRLVEECVRLSKEDYDSFETSRDFKRHPLI